MSDLTIADRTIDGPHGPIPVRLYAPESARAGFVWLHGGGFAAGDLDMPEADWVCRTLAAAGIAVVSVDYRLAPVPEGWDRRADEATLVRKHHPAASDEGVVAFTWATSAADAGETVPWSAHLRWALGGASAGGNVATATALRLVHGAGPVPDLLVLAYPTLHAVQPPHSAELTALLEANPEHAGFTPEVIAGMYANFIGGAVADADLYAVPGTATADDLAGFPPTLMVNDELDALRTSGEDFARRLADAGIPIDVSVESGESHGHLNRAEAAAEATLARFAAGILALADTPSSLSSQEA